MQILSDHEVLMSGRFALDDAREVLNLDIGDSEADTIGGLVYERLGSIPKAGDALQLGRATLTVEVIRGRRIQTVRVSSTEPLLVAQQPRNALREEHQQEEPRAAHG
ncbi:MAG: hypothetical protein JOY68_03215, partial [Candidatus Dormibacteraeota bacterium]|nr:hypothetical protein [Candidatus Dormibacteraeota bacterium]